jgi:hypothetical protein
MEKEDAGKLILDGFENGLISIKWNKRKSKKKNYQTLITQGEKLGLLVEVCAGCGSETNKRDCGCPCGTNLIWTK